MAAKELANKLEVFHTQISTIIHNLRGAQNFEDEDEFETEYYIDNVAKAVKKLKVITDKYPLNQQGANDIHLTKDLESAKLNQDTVARDKSSVKSQPSLAKSVSLFSNTSFDEEFKARVKGTQKAKNDFIGDFDSMVKGIKLPSDLNNIKDSGTGGAPKDEMSESIEDLVDDVQEMLSDAESDKTENYEEPDRRLSSPLLDLTDSAKTSIDRNRQTKQKVSLSYKYDTVLLLIINTEDQK